MGCGLLIAGCVRGLLSSLSLVEAMSAALWWYPEEQERIADLISSIYFTLYGIIMFVFPIVGSALNEAIGFRYAMDVIGLVLLANASVYFISTIIDKKKEALTGSKLKRYGLLSNYLKKLN